MKKLVVSQKILMKLAEKHGVSLSEVHQCFENIEGIFLDDDRTGNRTVPPTQWFLACTNQGRLVKIVFVPKDGKVFLKTAYPPNRNEIRLYKEFGEFDYE